MQLRVQPSHGQCSLHPNRTHSICLVQLKIARDAPRLLGFAILVWTIPVQVVQIHIAISATEASGRVLPRLQHSAQIRGKTEAVRLPIRLPPASGFPFDHVELRPGRGSCRPLRGGPTGAVGCWRGGCTAIYRRNGLSQVGPPPPGRTRLSQPRPGHAGRACAVRLGDPKVTMPRACWCSQSWSGRSQRRSSRFTLQFRRPAHPGVSSGCSTQPIPSSRAVRAELFGTHAVTQ